jgi:23S rRNA pseudouridine1911/1915/1917 synthase
VRRRFTVREGGRADRVLAAELPEVGRRTLADAFAAGRVRLGGARLKKGSLLSPGQVLEVEGELVPATSAPPVPEPERPLELLHVDEGLVVVNKPAGWPTHPLRPGELGTVASAVVARFPECATASLEAREGGAAHRLDGGTTGCLLFARTRAVHEGLRAAFHAGQVDKSYLALVVGAVSSAGELDAAIAQRGGRAVVCDDDDALPAITRFVPRERLGELTLLECSMVTGRMHQVRVHLAQLGTPVLGDALYGISGANLPAVDGHFLHASRLGFVHPVTRARVVVEAPLPADREAILGWLRR